MTQDRVEPETGRFGLGGRLVPASPAHVETAEGEIEPAGLGAVGLLDRRARRRALGRSDGGVRIGILRTRSDRSSIGPFQSWRSADCVCLPALFILLAAYAVRQAAKLSLETRRARDLADEIAIPAALAADQVGGVAEAVRREVERAAAAANAAEQQLLSLRRSLV